MREARRLGLVRPGERLFIVTGVSEWRERQNGGEGADTMTGWTTRQSSPGSSRRPARPFQRVAVRCPYGFPAVTEQAPFGPDGEPFPTTYYLTCPWLVAALARIEAAGGVERWSQAAAQRPRARREPRTSRSGAARAAA